MQTYLSHLIHGVNYRYERTFQTDPDLNLSVRLVGLLFLTERHAWSEPSKKLPSFNNRPVLVAGRTIQAFAEFVESKQFPFEYDHAVGLFNKDLWSSRPGSSEDR